MEPMNSDQRYPQWQKRQLVLALVVSCALAAVLVSLAWLNHTRSLQTATKIHVPALWIDNVRGTNAMNLGEIDVRNPTEYTMIDNVKRPCRRYVFSVCSNATAPGKFLLQLAYTTNIDFTYRVFAATEFAPDEAITEPGNSITVGGYRYVYSDDSLWNGDAVRYPEKTYARETDVYDLVHKDADPKYLISEEQDLETDPKVVPILGTKVRYYVLEVSWDSNQQNNKETDMVYLMAENTRS